jgi:hypothetical protein
MLRLRNETGRAALLDGLLHRPASLSSVVTERLLGPVTQPRNASEPILARTWPQAASGSGSRLPLAIAAWRGTEVVRKKATVSASSTTRSAPASGMRLP